MCMCVGDGGRKGRNQDSRLDVLLRLSEGSYTLTVDPWEEQTEQQTLQPRHRSYKCRHCMCVRNCVTSSWSIHRFIVHAVQLQATATPKYTYIARQRHPYIKSLPTPWYLRIESPASPPFQPQALSRSSCYDFIPKRGRRLPCPTPLTNVQFAIPRTLSISVKLTKCVQRRSSAAGTLTLQEGREAAGNRTLITTLPPFGDKQAATPSLKSSCKHTHPPAMNISASALLGLNLTCAKLDGPY